MNGNQMLTLSLFHRINFALKMHVEFYLNSIFLFNSLKFISIHIHVAKTIQ